MLHRITRYRVRAEKLAEAVALVEAYVDEVGRKEGGTALCRALQEAADPTRIMLYAVFRTKPAEESHRKAPWGKAFREKLAPLCSEAPVETEAKALGER